MTRCKQLAVTAAISMAFAMAILLPAPSALVADKSGDLLKDVQVGNPELKSVGNLSFGPDGLLLIAEPASASVLAIETGDKGPVKKLEGRVDDVQKLVAEALGAPEGSVRIIDMTVNPASGKIYLSVVRTGDNQAMIVTIGSTGQVAALDLKAARYVRVAMPEQSKIRNITDLKFSGDRVVVAAQNNEEFSSKIYTIPVPLKHDASVATFSTETYHVAHGRWETKAPIQSFVPVEEDGKQFVVGAFACTPIAKFPLDDMKSGSQVRGTSVVELGSGNRPLDMFTYEKDGKKWLVTNTYRFHFKRSTFGPSKWWGVRVNMDYLDAKDINEVAARRDISQKAGPNGIEIVDALFGALQVAQLNNEEIVVLRVDRETDSESKLSLEMATLP